MFKVKNLITYLKNLVQSYPAYARHRAQDGRYRRLGYSECLLNTTITVKARIKFLGAICTLLYFSRLDSLARPGHAKDQSSDKGVRNVVVPGR